MSLAMPDPTPAAPVADLEQKVVGALKKIYDPEIPVNIHDLDLIYSVNVADGGSVQVTMTLTAPACPVAGTLTGRGGEGRQVRRRRFRGEVRSDMRSSPRTSPASASRIRG